MLFGEADAKVGIELTEWQRTLKISRRILCWCFAAISVKGLAEAARDVSHVLRESESLRLLRGPIPPAVVATATFLVGGFAWWKTWKERRSARSWTITLGTILILSFFTRFVFSIRTGWDHGLFAVFLGLLILVAFWGYDPRAKGN